MKTITLKCACGKEQKFTQPTIIRFDRETRKNGSKEVNHMAWTKRSYDALFRWPEGPAGQAVATRMMLADGLRDQVDRLIQAQNLGVWWQITGEAADVVGPAIVEASAKDAEKELDSAVGL